MICDLDTKMWSDPWFEGLKPNAKLLFIYLWSSPHKNLPCLYEITQKTMAHETGFSMSEIKKLLKILHPKIKYYEADNIIWVVNSVRRQFLKSLKVSPKIVKGIENALCLLPHGHPLIEEFLNKYSVLDITYDYTTEDYRYPSSEEEGVSVGEGAGEGKDIKHRYGEFQKVQLTDNEYTRLVEKLGDEEQRDHWIKTLDEGIYQKKYKYTSHYMAILSWKRNGKQNGVDFI